MPLITVTMYPGRSRQQKSNFVQGVVQAAVEHLGTTPNAVEIIIYEVAREHWALAGRLPDELPSKRSALRARLRTTNKV